MNKPKKDQAINLFQTDFILIKSLNQIKYYKNYIELFKRYDSDKKLPIIPIMVESDGGYTDTMYFILNLIMSCKKPVATWTINMANSAGALLLSAGTPGFRFATETATSLIHYVQVDNKSNLKETKIYMKYFNKFTKKSNDYWIKKLDKNNRKELVLTGNNIKDEGLVDHIGLPIVYL